MEKNMLPVWMVKTFGILVLILLALLIFLLMKDLQSPSQVLKVSAEGKVMATPDLATLTIGVTSQGQNPVDVKNENNKKINQIIAFIKQQDIESDDIATTEFYASPRFNYVNGQSNIVGYQADQSITVKVRKVDKSKEALEKILDGVVDKGANKVQGVIFGFSDPEKQKELARKLAIKNAKEKAEALADEAGLSLGRVINIQESADGFVNPFPRAVNLSMQAQSVAPDIQLGSQQIVENITLVFDVK